MLSDDQREEWLLLIERGMDRQEAAYAVGEIPSTFRKLALTDLAFRKRMIDALNHGKRQRKIEEARVLTKEEREEFLDLIRTGKRPLEAAKECDIYLRRLYKGAFNPVSPWYDREFHQQFKDAVAEWQPAFVERLQRLTITQAENGDYRALKDLNLVYDPDWRPLLTKRVEIGNAPGDAFRLAAMQALESSNLTLEEVEQWIALAEKASGHKEDPPPLELVSGDG